MSCYRESRAAGGLALVLLLPRRLGISCASCSWLLLARLLFSSQCVTGASAAGRAQQRGCRGPFIPLAQPQA